MTPTLEFHALARQELNEARAWYEQRNPAAAERFSEEVEHALDRIKESPRSWPPNRDETRRCLMHRFPYAIIYTQLDDAIYVLAVAHGRRKPGYWKDRNEE